MKTEARFVFAQSFHRVVFFDEFAHASVLVPKVFVGVTCESMEESFDDCATERFGRLFPRDVVDAREMEVFEHPTQFIVCFAPAAICLHAK